MADELPPHRNNEQDAELSWIERYERHLEIAGSLVVALIGATLWVIGGKLGQDLGANFISAGGIALVVFLAYEQLSRDRRQKRSGDHEAALKEIAKSLRDVRDYSEQTGTQIQDTIKDTLAQSIDEFHIAKEIGLTGYTVGRPKNLNERVLAAKKNVDILEISLKTMQGIGASAWRACEADIRIILLDPCFPANGSPLARLRDAEEHQGDGQILTEIAEILDTFPSEWFSAAVRTRSSSVAEHSSPEVLRTTSRQGSTTVDWANANDLHVKLAQVMPTMSYFRIDDIAYFAPLVHRRLGHETMHLQLEQGGLLFDALGTHFNQLWTDEKHVVPADPSQIPDSYV